MRPTSVPLARLLALGYRQLIDGLHARLAARGYRDIRPAFGYVLLAVREAPTTAADLAVLLSVTKQAASKLVDAMERGGYLKRQSHGQDARAKEITLTPKGRRFLATVEVIYRELETEWAQVTGKARLEALRADVQRVVEAAHGGRLPSVRPV